MCRYLRAPIFSIDHLPNNAISCRGLHTALCCSPGIIMHNPRGWCSSCPPSTCFQLGGICRRHQVGVLDSGWVCKAYPRH